LEEHYPVRLRRLLNIPTEKGDELYVNQLVSIYGFKILGAEAASAVPDLMKTLRAGEVESSAFAAEALTYIGEPAAPSLSTLLTDPDFAVRKAATNAMNAIADRAIGKIPIPE
jgi:HEAT repeat protein